MTQEGACEHAGEQGQYVKAHFLAAMEKTDDHRIPALSATLESLGENLPAEQALPFAQQIFELCWWSMFLSWRPRYA